MVKENGMVMLSENELEQMSIEKEQVELDYQRRIELLQEAVATLARGLDNGPQGVRVSKIDFLEIYNKALDDMDENPEDNDIYGNDFFIYWNGIYCNCGDGAVACNNIIPGIEGVLDEDPTEY